jgi:hypothetical protein
VTERNKDISVVTCKDVKVVKIYGGVEIMLHVFLAITGRCREFSLCHDGPNPTSY